ncbi:MAG: AbrB/MazE/SpoVT family DNA-binding domain-containing protein [Ruminococcaceae bacterium]|nr:AbrB/MazE/SpoVT family DNA-binding domain-containing protein [Oscillospiraceae bacterium]
MKSTSARPVDELGRIVLPITVRRAFDIKEKDILEIFAQGDCIIMKKVQNTCCFCDNTENMIEFSGKYICPQCLEQLKNT